MTVRSTSAALLVAGFAVGEAALASFAEQAAAPRPVVVVSDLHMGAGRDRSGSWQPLEDFRWAAEWGAFLETIDKASGQGVDLIFNGDTFDLLESVTGGCVYAEVALGCTEGDAMARLERVIAAHAAEIGAIGRFVRSGSNRVVFVPGDRDAAILFPALARRLVRAIGAPRGRVEVATPGYWLSADGQIYAEHGHQIGSSAHSFEDWPSPFLNRAGRQHLARPWGEQVIQGLYNRLEERYALVDNVAVAGAGVKYALSADGASDVGEVAPWLLRYLLFTMSWQQFRMELDDGEVEPPVWDIPRVRGQGAAFLLSALPDDDPFKPLAAKALADGRLSKLVEELSDEDVTTICDYRAAVRRSRRRFEAPVTQFVPRGPVVTECPRTPETRGAIFDYFWRSRDQQFGRHLETVAARLPGRARPIVFVHGHTHLADRAQSGAIRISGGLPRIPPEGFSPVRGALTPVVINGGAWQRTMTPVQLERIKAERNLPLGELLRSLQPEQLTPCYSFVQIGTTGGAPAPEVRYWRQAASGEWGLAGNCGR